MFRRGAVVNAALRRVHDGHGQVVSLVGEPGVGKSRLVREIVHSDATTGFSVLECGAGAHGGSAAYRPVVDLLHAYFRIQSHDDVDEIRARVAERLDALPALSTPHAALAILALLDVPVDDATWLAMDPPLRRRVTLDACIEIFVAESRRRSLLLVIEDLQGIDAETQALLDELAEHVASARLGILVNYRPEYQHTWSGADRHTLVRLHPLPAGAAADLLASLLGNDPRLSPLKAVLMERTDGNPFFLEECVQTLVESGALTGRRGQRRLLVNLTELPIPATVQAILATRIDRLPPDPKRLLQSAAVIGKEVPFAILRAVADQPDDVLQRALMQLQESQILYEAGLFPELRYTFKHALTHDVAYRGMLRSRRVALHARVVDAIESLGAERLAEEVDVLAHHALRGQMWSAAVGYARLAGQKAAQASANRSAAASFAQALQALAELPAGQTRNELEIDLRLDLGRALHPLGGQRQSITFAREACELAEALGDARRFIAANGLAASSLFFLGEYPGSIEAAERTLLAAETLGDLSLQLRARNQLAQPMAAIGRFRQAATHHAWIVAAADGFDFREHREHTSDPGIAARAYQAWCLAALGDEADAATIGERAITLAEALGHPYTLTFTLMFVGDVYLILGDVPRAVPILERAWELTRVWDFGLLTPTCASWLGAAYVESGRSVDGLALLESAVPCRDHVQESRMYMRLARGQLHVGQLDAAEASGLCGLEVATRRTERPHQALALQVLGEIAARREPPDTAAARRAFEEALHHAEASQMTRVAGACRERLAFLRDLAEPGHTEIVS
jgi:tetratricopeptide (TPR) repeat protein